MTSITAANLPREARALLDAIAQGESDPTARREGISPYVILYGGGSFEGMPDREGYNGFPDWPGKDNSHAAGRYQFEPATWKSIVADFPAGTPNFRNPGDQDWGAWFLAQRDFESRAGAPLLGQLQAGVTQHIGGTLQSTWTSLSDSTFPGRYTAALMAIPETPPPTIPPVVVQPPIQPLPPVVPPVQPPIVPPPPVVPPSPFADLIGQVQTVIENVNQGHAFVLAHVPETAKPEVDRAYAAVLRSVLVAMLSQ